LDGKGPKRFIIYGRFDEFLVAEIRLNEDSEGRMRRSRPRVTRS
jgi:hypothetical protein